MECFDTTFKELLSSSTKVFWAGKNPPLNWMESTEDLFNPQLDYRLPPSLHQQFAVVYLVEIDLGSLKAWPLILDETLRLLAPEGILVLRMSNTKLLSIFELKNFISNWSNFAIYFEHHHEDGTIQFAIKNLHNKKRKANLSSFSFGVITDGKRLELLKDFINSIENLEKNGENIEVIICGPSSMQNEFNNTSLDIKVISEPNNFREYGWITKKKNLITQNAKYENLIIAHDRYRIAKSFLQDFKKFGGDYSVLVCRQLQGDGRRIPDWVTLGTQWAWTAPAVLEYGDWSRHLYINGGIIVAKTEILRKIGWNELLFWNQAEDVELTRRLYQAGHVARLARCLTVYSAPTRKGFLECFEAIPFSSTQHILPSPLNPNEEKILPSFKFNQYIKLGSHFANEILQAGIYLDSNWERNSNYIFLAANKFGEIIFRLASKPSTPIFIKLEIKNSEPQEIIKIIANEIPAKYEIIENNILMIEVPETSFELTNVLRLYFFSGKTELKYLSITLQNYLDEKFIWRNSKQLFNDQNTLVKNTLLSGWSGLEPWGCWTVGHEAKLDINIEGTIRNLLIEGEAKAFCRPNTTSKRIGVLINDIPIYSFKLKNNFKTGLFTLKIPSDLLGRCSNFTITFIPHDPCAPNEFGISNDDRKLGMGLISLNVRKMPIWPIYWLLSIKRYAIHFIKTYYSLFKIISFKIVRKIYRIVKSF